MADMCVGEVKNRNTRPFSFMAGQDYFLEVDRVNRCVLV